MRLRYHTLDVFTETRFGGNPLAIVLEADSLDSDRMQSIAREFNLSETVFVLKPANPMHSARVRIFTPVTELPFAGHPTVGTAVLLAELRSADLGASRESIIVLEETVGNVRVGVRMRPGRAPFAEFDAPRLPQDMGSAGSIDDIAAAVGLIPNEIGFENHKPSRWSAGMQFSFVPVRDLEAIGRARVAQSRWERAFDRMGGAFLYSRETVRSTSHFHARMFAPGRGSMEDPATGSAAAALAGVVLHFDSPPAGEHRYVIEQGFEMGRPSHISMAMVTDGSRLDAVRIGGHAVRVGDGEIEV